MVPKAILVNGGVAGGGGAGNDRNRGARWLGVHGNGCDGGVSWRRIDGGGDGRINWQSVDYCSHSGVSWCRIDNGSDGNRGRSWCGTYDGGDGDHGWRGINRDDGRRIDRRGADGNSARRKLVSACLWRGIDVLHFAVFVTPLHLRVGLLDPNLTPIFSSAIPLSICTHLRVRIPGVGESNGPMERFAGFEIDFFLAKRNRLYRLIDYRVNWFAADHCVDGLARNDWRGGWRDWSRLCGCHCDN